MMKKSGTNSTNMKLDNRRLILSIIRKNPISRAELARKTGLTRATVTLLIDEMVNIGIVMETVTARADFGRKPVLLDLNPSSYYIVGVYISREGCSVGVVNIKGELLLQHEAEFEVKSNFDENINNIIEGIKKVMADSGLAEDKLLGIGVSSPGPVDINNGIILNPPNFDAWHNMNIVGELKKTFQLDIFLDNNASSLTLAEKNYGRGVEFSNFMLMVVDTGIGAGIIINDKLYRGVGGFGSEIGHTSIDLNGRVCNCGNIGCIEAYASMPAVISDIQQYDKSIKSWKQVIDKASEGDKFCAETIIKEARYLSVGIVNVMNLLELEAIILTGDISYKSKLLIDKISEDVNNFAITRNIHKFQVLNSPIKEESKVVSAAAIILEKFFRGEI